MRKLFTLFAIFLFANAQAQTLELAANINQDGSSYFLFSSKPSEIVTFNNKLYFSAKGPSTGYELYSFNGTTHQLEADLYTGVTGLDYNSSFPTHLTVSNGDVYFTANDGTIGDTLTLFKTDGASAPVALANLGLPAGYGHYVTVFDFNDKLYYTSYDNLNGEWQLWEYDDVTNSPTVIFAHSSAIGASFKSFVVYNSKMYFYKSTVSSKIWEYDGTNAPIQAPNTGSLTTVEEAVVYNGKLYFNAYESTGNTGYEPWVYDGTNAPSLLSDIYTGVGSSSPSNFKVFNSKLYFQAQNAASGIELWSTDGTTTSMVAEINISASSSPKHLTIFNNKLYFSANDGTNGIELWQYDGTNAPSLASDINPGALNGDPKFMAVLNNKLYFNAFAATVGEELYQFDGTTTTLAANIYNGDNGSAINHLTEYKGKMYFAALGVDGYELWSFDGTTATQIADIDTSHTGQFGAATGSNPNRLKVFNNLLYFYATSTTYDGYWQYDGVSAPTTTNHLPDDANNLTEFNGKLYFTSQYTGDGTELYAYSPATNSITLVFDINPGMANASPSGFAIFNSKLYFNANDGTNGQELWVYDGTNNPTMVADISAGATSSYPDGMYGFNGKLYFAAEADTAIGYELYSYDGTNAPTLVIDLFPGMDAGYANSGYPHNFKTLDNKLVFVANTDTFGNELWAYDGTNAPTMITNYVVPSSASYQFYSMTEIDGALYFWANDGSGKGDELFKYDGIGAPVMFPELYVGPLSTRPSNPSNILKYDGDIYLGACDGFNTYINSSELFKIAACNIDTAATLSGSTLTAAETGATYQWLDCDNGNAAIANETNVSFTPTATGNYACEVTKGGCVETTACKNVIISGIEYVMLDAQVVIYPNPSSNLINIQSHYPIQYINIYNVLGAKVQTETNTQFSVSNLQNGMYFIQVTTEQGVANKQFIKQ